jgi:5-methylcytosine-specific restriction endonuclease McrA
MKRKCLCCGNIYKAVRKKQKYCSKKCCYKYRDKYLITPERRQTKRERARKRYYSDVDYRRKKIDSACEGKLRIRFAVLKRDDFTCQYCGRKAPSVILQLDHIYPKSKGGSDSINNYRTACAECNLGKSDIPL